MEKVCFVLVLVAVAVIACSTGIPVVPYQCQISIQMRRDCGHCYNENEVAREGTECREEMGERLLTCEI